LNPAPDQLGKVNSIFRPTQVLFGACDQKFGASWVRPLKLGLDENHPLKVRKERIGVHDWDHFCSSMRNEIIRNLQRLPTRRPIRGKSATWRTNNG
jgi:hypothetical protein